jgi:hypothetical protein
MVVDNKALISLRILLFVSVLLGPAAAPAQQEQQNRPPDEDSYGSRFFDQLRSIFGRFRDADLQNVFQQAKPIQCSELVGRKGEWREVAFFNENRKLGDWCKQSLDEVKGDLSVYTFKGVCSGDQGTVQVATEFPIGDGIEAYNQKRIDFDQIDINVNDPVNAVFDSRTMALTFELPYLFLTGHERSGSTYSFIAPNRNSAYASDVTSRWACKAVSSNDVTYRFLICRTSTAPRNAGARNRNWEPAFGASAFFILSDGSEATTSVNLSFGDGSRRVEGLPETGSARPAPGRPTLGRTGAVKRTGNWETADANAKVVEAARDGFRLRFSNQTWAGKIAAPELLSDQKMSSLPQNRPPEGMDYCVWNPDDADLVGRLLANPPDPDVVHSLGTLGKSSQSAASIFFDFKTGPGVRIGRLQCYFPRAQSAAEISVDRWVSIVGGHLTLEIMR